MPIICCIDKCYSSVYYFCRHYSCKKRFFYCRDHGTLHKDKDKHLLKNYQEFCKEIEPLGKLDCIKDLSKELQRCKDIIIKKFEDKLQ